MRTEIARLQRRLGTTTVYVTHDQVEAMTLGDRVAVLRRGRLQQVDAPRALYERPANLFVAGFVGSPSMNLLPARVEEAALSLPFGRIPLPPELLRRLTPHAEIVAGIRPEHLEDAALVPPDARARGAELDVAVDVTEWLGDRQLAYVPYDAPGDASAVVHGLARELDVEAPRTQLVLSLDPASAIRGGARARLWLDQRNVQLFDPRTGASLTAGA
jgi:multiple sugar transport system ATP-binding protein